MVLPPLSLVNAKILAKIVLTMPSLGLLMTDGLTQLILAAWSASQKMGTLFMVLTMKMVSCGLVMITTSVMDVSLTMELMAMSQLSYILMF
jgi:hypothetical protein